jgi:hypothetical protein
MATFKCNACGNLHGARVDNCGMCGSQEVALLPDVPPTEPPPPPRADALPSSADAASIGDVLKPLFEDALDYVRARDNEREERLTELDERESQRRERVTHAKCELLEQAGNLLDKLMALTDAATSYFQREPPTKPDR